MLLVALDSHAFSASAQQAMQQLWSRIPADTRQALQQQANQSSQFLNQTKTDWADQASQRSEQMQQSLRQVSDQAEAIATKTAQGAEDLLSQPMQQWLAEHRALGWAMEHPIWAAIAGLALAIISFNLLRIVLNPRYWLLLLSAPLRFSQKQVGQVPLSLEQTLRPGEIRQGEVRAILRRLDALAKEQEILHGQLKALLGGQKTES